MIGEFSPIFFRFFGGSGEIGRSGAGDGEADYRNRD